jgi:hypothetical protein
MKTGVAWKRATRFLLCFYLCLNCLENYSHGYDKDWNEG